MRAGSHAEVSIHGIITLYCTLDWLYKTYKVKMGDALFPPDPELIHKQAKQSTGILK